MPASTAGRMLWCGRAVNGTSASRVVMWPSTERAEAAAIPRTEQERPSNSCLVVYANGQIKASVICPKDSGVRWMRFEVFGRIERRALYFNRAVLKQPYESESNTTHTLKHMYKRTSRCTATLLPPNSPCPVSRLSSVPATSTPSHCLFFSAVKLTFLRSFNLHTLFFFL